MPETKERKGHSTVLSNEAWTNAEKFRDKLVAETGLKVKMAVPPAIEAALSFAAEHYPLTPKYLAITGGGVSELQAETNSKASGKPGRGF